MEAAKSGKLRVFGLGYNRICFTHIDNYCHGLIISEKVLYPDSPALDKFYIITDGKTHPKGGQYLLFWKIMDEVVMAMGFTSLWSKAKLPTGLLMFLAAICEFIGNLLGITMKLNKFNVTVLTMHRWFDIKAAEKDLDFQPIVGFREGWDETIEWFKQNWLPKQAASKSLFGIASATQDKIDIQDISAKKVR